MRRLENTSVSDEEIRQAAELLGLSDHAFHGKDGKDPRQEVLKSMEAMDISACPGSGKTTLLVAKLAILAAKWRCRTRGICVLSHTNAARLGIEAGLGGTSVARRLLSYPHFVGTIHAFVNEFLALPWLRSRGVPVKLIDTEICERRRWRKLDYAFRSALEKRHIGESSLRIIDAGFGVAKKSGALPVGPDTRTYEDLQRVCRETTLEGIHCYDDMFVWAHNLIDECQGVPAVLRDRFPVLFIDEAQDNSEAQSSLLHRVFGGQDAGVVRQRFGDANQAIYHSVGAEAASTDVFPGADAQRDLPSSHRFGQGIADLADPLGVVPQGLKGLGPRRLGDTAYRGRPTVLLFDETKAGAVLDAYGDLLTKTFSERGLREGAFVAVGQTHRPPDVEASHKFPHHVAHYWPEYEAELARVEPAPGTFSQYVLAGQGRAEATREAHPAVEKIAAAFLRLGGMAGDMTLGRRRYGHRYILRLLERDPPVQACYRMLISRFAVELKPLTRESWNNRWAAGVRRIAEALAGAPLTSDEAVRFLEWGGEPNATAEHAGDRTGRDNVYLYPHVDPKVRIRVGSIHSVKGETHTATLVLETFWFGHNLDALKPWIVGARAGLSAGGGPRQLARLKTHYVAMTRPSHLLCLAMRRASFEEGPVSVDDLVQRGWRVEFVS